MIRRKCYLDTETCGLHGLPVIIQYAFDDGPVAIFNFWTTPIDETLALIEDICECEVIGFNLAFDWFHISKIYTTLKLAKGVFGGHAYPDDHIKQIGELEERARDGDCVKPFAALDLMLHARKTEFQMTMERSDIRIRKVPTALASKLADTLEEGIEFSALLFARQKKLSPKWTLHPSKNRDGTISKDFRDIVLKFKPSIALKMLAMHALKVPASEIIPFTEIEVPRHYWPAELGYSPYCASLYRLSRKEYKKALGLKWRRRPWPEVIQYHIAHWNTHVKAREYAAKDVVLTRSLHGYFGSPACGDDDSELACSVASVRWRGYAIDIPGVRILKEEAEKKLRETPTAPAHVKRWIGATLSATELAMFTSTGKVILEKMAAVRDGMPCPFMDYHSMGPCEDCKDTGTVPGPESAHRAYAVLQARMCKKEIELYDKLLLAGRFHASFKVTGALSNRMSGADGLNPQGIKKTKEVRRCFPLAFGELDILVGGDFAGFEVTLADAAYNDPILRKDLLTCEVCRDVQVEQIAGSPLAREHLSSAAFAKYLSLRTEDEQAKAKKAARKNESYVCKSTAAIAEERLKGFACPKCGMNQKMKIHALFGMSVYPGMTYDEIKATDGTSNDLYTKAKSAIFAMIYGGMAFTLMTRLGVPIEVAEAAYKRFIERYLGVGQARQRIISAFCTLKQEGGVGSKIVYADAEEYVESLLGFRRYFTLENMIVRSVFALAESPPKDWADLKVKVRRRDRDQTASGAVQSALFGAAFGIQSGVMRAAANHEIQSSGAGITKRVQRNIWDIQPHGVHPWLVQPMNIHDQVLCPLHPSVVDRVAKIVYDTVESFRGKVPLIELEWKEAKTWGDK